MTEKRMWTEGLDSNFIAELTAIMLQRGWWVAAGRNHEGLPVPSLTKHGVPVTFEQWESETKGIRDEILSSQSDPENESKGRYC